MSQNLAALCPQAFDCLFDACDKQRLFNEINRQHKKTYAFLVAGGFQLSPQNLHTHRKRLRQKLAQLGTELLLIPEVAAAGKGPWTTLHAVLTHIPTDQVLNVWKPLLRCARQPAAVILALFLFPEATPLRKLALKLFKCPTAWTPQPQPREQPGVREIQALMQAFAPPAPEPGAREGEPDGQDFQQRLQAEIQKFRNERELDDAKAHKKRKVELQQARRELAEATATIADLQRKLADAKDRAQQDLDALRASLEQNYQKSHEAFLTQTLQVDHQLQIDAEQAQETTQALLLKIQEATFQQRTLNRNHGSRHSLRQQKEQLQDALRDLQLAADDSFVTVRDLKSIIAQTTRHIAQIEGRLTGQESFSVSFSLLETHIQSIPVDHNAERRLKAAEDFIQEAVNHEILQENEAGRLVEILSRKRKLLHNLKLRPLEQSLREMKTQDPQKGPREIWHLARQFVKLSRVTLIFDGYNAMIRNQIWADMAEAKCFAVARQHFVDKVKSKASLFHAVEIIFDGNGTTDTVDAVQQNLKVVYAARKCDAHNADDYIVRRATELTRNRQADLIWIVTNDYGLRTRLEQVCDAYVETSTVPDFFLA